MDLGQILMPRYHARYFVRHVAARRVFEASDAAAARKRFTDIVAQLQDFSRDCRDFELTTERGKHLAGVRPAERRWTATARSRQMELEW